MVFFFGKFTFGTPRRIPRDVFEKLRADVSRAHRESPPALQTTHLIHVLKFTRMNNPTFLHPNTQQQTQLNSNFCFLNHFTKSQICLTMKNQVEIITNKNLLNATTQRPNQCATFHQHTSFTKYLNLCFLRYRPICDTKSQISRPPDLNF